LPEGKRNKERETGRDKKEQKYKKQTGEKDTNNVRKKGNVTKTRKRASNYSII